MMTAITVIATVYLLLGLGALLSDRLIFLPQKSSYSDAEIRKAIDRDKAISGPLSNAQLVKLTSGRKSKTHTITAIYIPNDQARFTLLFSHGNAEDIGHNLEFFEMLRRSGFAVFAYDYRGYGTSEGRPSEGGVYEDVEAAYDYLTNQLKVPPSQIISHGRSVGCGAAIHLATERSVAGLIAESPFLSAFRVMTRVPLLPFDKFNNARKIKRVHAPLLVIHGRRDEVIPFSHGQGLFNRANEPKQNYWVEGAGHNNLLFVAGQSYFEALQRFAASIP